MNQESKPTSCQAKRFLLLSFCFCGLASHIDVFYFATWSGIFYPSIIFLVGILLAASLSLLILAARATMVTWITVLVLLACSGKRRHSLVLDGKKITIDVALQLVEVMLSERSRVVIAAAFAMVFSILAKVRACKI